MSVEESLKFRVVREKSGGLELQEHRKIDENTWAIVDRMGPFSNEEFKTLFSYLASIIKKNQEKP